MDCAAAYSKRCWRIRYAGTIYPVSRSAAEVQGLKAYPSVADLPEPADLAILIIPARIHPR